MDTGIVKKPRKKVCPRCKRKLWLRDFYFSRTTGRPHSYCKECSNEYRRSTPSYVSRLKPDGIFYTDNGQKVQKKGYSRKIYWDGNMLSILRRYFPNTRNEEVAEMLGVSPRTVVRKARELGIDKDPDFCKEMSRQASLLAYAENRRNGYRGLFQKGHTPWNKGKKLKTIQLIEHNEKETIKLHHQADTLLQKRRDTDARTQLGG